MEAMLFDLGCVTVGRDIEECESVLASSSDFKHEAFLSVLWDAGWIRRFERGEISTGEFHQFRVKKGLLKMDYTEFRRAWSEVFDPIPIPPTAFLWELTSRYTMTVVSKANEVHEDYIRRNCEFFDCFTHHMLSSQIGTLKPDPKIFEAAIVATGHAPETVLFIDDREENVVSGRALGTGVHRFSLSSALCWAFKEMGIEFERPVKESIEDSNTER